jgi:hypothetical protein
MPNSTVDDEKLRQDAVATMSRYVQFDTTNPPGNEMPPRSGCAINSSSAASRGM